MTQNSRELVFPFAQVVVVGGTGQTGHRVLESVLASGVAAGLKIFGTSREFDTDLGYPRSALAQTVMHDIRAWGARVSWAQLDLEATEATVLNQLEQLGKKLHSGVPTLCVLAAAFTNVDGCETDSAKCARINETNTVAVLDWARRKFDATLVFYSTDYVFDGTSGPYAEEAPRNAQSRYGLSKVYVEEWLENNVPAERTLILRTTGVFDYLPGSKNFLMQMLDLWGQGKTTRIPSDQFSNPICAVDLARATLELLCNHQSGIFNVAGGSWLARSEFALAIARIFGHDPELIQPVLTAELGQKAKRPLRGGLRMKKLKKVLGWAPEPAEVVLKKMRR